MRPPFTDELRRRAAAHRRTRVAARAASPDRIAEFDGPAVPERRFTLRPPRTPPGYPSGNLSHVEVNRLLHRFIRAAGVGAGSSSSESDSDDSELDSRSRSVIVEIANALQNVARIAVRNTFELNALKMLRKKHGWPGDVFIDGEASNAEVLRHLASRRASSVGLVKMDNSFITQFTEKPTSTDMK